MCVKSVPKKFIVFQPDGVVGSLNVDQISYCPRLPGPGETLMGTKYETGLGGKGANQARDSRTKRSSPSTRLGLLEF